jgi:capsular polysaccharide export protein
VAITMLSPYPRRILLLQGPPTAFFTVLERAFEHAGVPVSRVLLHAGDRLKAKGRGIPFRDRPDAFDGFLEALMMREGITDVVYFADRLPYHRIAARVAGRLGATPYAVENGYLRPDWLTLEPGGMGAFSRFPVDRAAIERIAHGAPPVEGGILYRHSFAREAFEDVTYHLARLAGRPGFAHYDADKPNPVLLEYLSWIPQLARRQAGMARGPARLRRFMADGRPFFLLPLQLADDYQIRHNSPYARLTDMVDEVFASFARAAPRDARLLVKIHPLDNGLTNWPQVLRTAAAAHGLAGRVASLSGGGLKEILLGCEGVVLVNSTVGLHAVRALRPTKALGVAVYDLPGLTDQEPLDSFWQAPRAPDPFFVDVFVRALARATQLRGSFYDRDGMRAASATIVDRVLAGHGADDMFVTPPPRLSRARAIGVPLDGEDAQALPERDLARAAIS